MSGWQFKNLDDAVQLISTNPIGSASVDFKPIEIELAPNLSFGGAGGALAINPRGKFTVAVLNDPTDVDEDEILQKEGAEIADDRLPPHGLLEDGPRLKFRVEAGVKATGARAVADLIGLEGGGEFGVVFADYRQHDKAQATREAFLADIRRPRFVTNHADVKNLAPGEVLAFRRSGAIHAAVTLKLSDVFTGQIGTLGRLLGTTMPLALSFKAGATVTAEVRVEDDFIVAFSRVSARTWRAGVRKARSNTIAPSLDAGISVGFADEAAVAKLLAGVVDSTIGAPLDQVSAILAKVSLERLSAVERRLATLVMERVGLDPVVTTLQGLAARVDEIQTTAVNLVKDVARTRIALSFAYEYSRIDARVNLLQVTLDAAGVQRFHQDLVRGRTLGMVEDLVAGRSGLTLETYLNQATVTSERSWGFTLAFGKWATLGGRDFTRMRKVQRADLRGHVQESYLGARGYKGSWAGESFEWSVDLKADMKGYVREPEVSDFSFGLHLAWLATQKKLSASELEQWLDLALIWRSLNDAALPEVRGRLSKALGRDAQASMQIVVPNAVMRSVLPRLSTMPPEAFAGALAAAMPWMEVSRARTDPSRRRAVYEPLWAAALGDARHTTDELAHLAADRMKDQGHSELVVRETRFLDAPDPFSFAGLARLNGDTRGRCAAFARGARILQSALDSGARNHNTIDKAFGEMNDLWTQSHHVRAIGVHLLDLAALVGQLPDVTRTLTIQSKALGEDIVVTA